LGQENNSNSNNLGGNYEVISLYDLIQILIKRKKLIILVFMICVLAAVVGSLMMDPVYRIFSVLSPGQYFDQEGQIRFVSSPENLSSIIARGSFHSQVLERLNWDPKKPENNIDVQTDLPRGTDNVYLSIDSANTDKAREYMNGLIGYLFDYYGQRTRVITGKIKNSINASEKKLSVLKETEKRLRAQLEQIQANTADIIAQRAALLRNPGEAETLPLLLYSNTIQQNVSYMDQLYKSLEENSMEQKNLEQNIDDLLLQLSGSNGMSGEDVIEKGSFEGLIVVQEPTVEPDRVKPNRTLMVALAAVLGLFLGIFMAFFKEFWQSQKKLHSS